MVTNSEAYLEDANVGKSSEYRYDAQPFLVPNNESSSLERKHLYCIYLQGVYLLKDIRCNGRLYSLTAADDVMLRQNAFATEPNNPDDTERRRKKPITYRVRVRNLFVVKDTPHTTSITNVYETMNIKFFS
jgi:hypothetical protein